MADLTPQGHTLGLVFGPKDSRTWAYSFTPMASPPQDMDWRPRLRPVGNQASIGSCTGWGFTAAVEAARQDDTQRSPLYLYYRDRQADGQNPPSQDTGATMLAACKALKDYGVPPDDLWPYDVSRYNVAPLAAADFAAAQCRADSYYQVQGTGLALLQGLWAALREGPCPIALQVYESFEANVGTNGKVPMPTSRERVLGGHCICACGWFNDNSAPGGYGYVVCQNSWGASMGDGGFYYLPAGYFTAGIVVEAWVVKLAAGPSPEPEDDVDPAIYDELQQALVEASAITGNLDTARYQLRDRDPTAAWTYVGEGSRLQGSQAQRLRRVLELLPPKDEPGPVDPPTPEPTPPIAAVIGTYSGHGLAQDAYAGLTPEQTSWGPHHGIPIIAPAEGRVELYTFGTPLNLAELALLSPDYVARHRDLFDGWTCAVPTTLRAGWPDDLAAPLFGAQTMYVAVFWPSAALVIEGQRIGHLHYGHVRGDVRTGAIAQGEQFATSHDSGIRFEPGVPNARAAHTHCCAGAGATLSPNGDLPGRLAAVAQGWTVTDIGTVPGPTQYQQGGWTAGRRTTDFTQGGHPIPPLPQ